MTAGYTIAVWLPPEAADAVVEELCDRIAALVHVTYANRGWDGHVVGQAGDPLAIGGPLVVEPGPVREMTLDEWVVAEREKAMEERR